MDELKGQDQVVGTAAEAAAAEDSNHPLSVWRVVWVL
jgi:hypothetical protein